MANTSSGSSSVLSRVDSLYGPATFAGWYLTVLACVFKWTLHPEKRQQDSVDADLIISLTLPAVAVVHLLSQASNFADRQHNSLGDKPLSAQELASAIEAPLVVVEAFMNVSAVLFLIALYHVTSRRALIIAASGLVCFLTCSYLRTSKVHSNGLSRLFSRQFFSDSAVALLFLAAMITTVSTTLISAFLYERRKTRKKHLAASITGLNQVEDVAGSAHSKDPTSIWHQRSSYKRRLRTLFREGRQAFIMVSAVMVVLPPSLAAYGQGLSVTFGASHMARPSVFSLVFPRCQSSMADLDQKVALIGGLTVLAFSLFQNLVEGVAHTATD